MINVHPMNNYAHDRMEAILAVLNTASKTIRFKALANPWLERPVLIAMISSVITVHYHPTQIAVYSDMELGQAVLRELEETRERFAVHQAKRPGKAVS